jgi:hypothetical protein
MIVVCAAASMAAMEPADPNQGSNGVFGLDAGITPSLAVNPKSTRFNVDQLGPADQPFGKTVTVGLGDRVLIRGWAVDTMASTLAGGVEISIDNHAYKLPYFLTRTDVAAALGSAAFADSGFLGIIPPQLLPEGQHDVVLRIIAADRRNYYQSPSIRMIVKSK